LKKELRKKKNLVKYIKSRPLIAGGYNLRAFLDYSKINDIITHLIVGSTGTLLLLSEVVLDLPREKPLKELYLLHFQSYEDMQKGLKKLMKLKPATIEFIGNMVLEMWGKKYGVPDTQGALLVGFENKTLIIGDNVLKIPRSQWKKVWKLREQALPKLRKKLAQKGLRSPSITDDVTFHPKDFSKIMDKVTAYACKKGFAFAVYGHIGIGSMHIRPFLKSTKHSTLQRISLDIFKILRTYKGTLIGEHNAGLSRSRFLELESIQMYAFMKKVKKVFDPGNMLNPHVMFSLESCGRYMKALNKNKIRRKR